MSNSNKITALAPIGAALMMSLVAQGVQAHAGFKDQITEGTSTNTNAITITHGCKTNAGGETSSTLQKDVVALSVLFPNSKSFSDVIMRQSNGSVPAQTGSSIGHTTADGDGTVGNEIVIADPNALSKDIVGAGVNGATGAIPLPLSITVVNPDNIFANTIPI